MQTQLTQNPLFYTVSFVLFSRRVRQCYKDEKVRDRTAQPIKMKKTKIYSLTISLNHWTPRIWRRLWVRGDMKLNKVAVALYSSMGWYGCHLSEIIANNKSYGDRSIDPPPNLLEWTKYTFGDIAKDGLTQFQFIKVMKNKKHPEYQQLSDWWGDESFNPSYFSIDEVNSIIQDKETFLQ